MPPAPRRAFTLVELMVVVTIIVILIALLVPALDKAMSTATKTQCLANLKAFSVGYRNYSGDNRGDVMAFVAASRVWSHYKLAPYMGYTGYGKQAVTGSEKFMICPETTVVVRGGDALSPSARETWQWDTGQGSYGFNLFLINYTLYNSGLHPASYYHLKLDGAHGQTPLAGDSNWIGSWPDSPSFDPGNYDNPHSPHDNSWFMSRHCIDRHGGFTTNLSFVDGSARNMILGELWNVPWHRKFNPSYKNGGWD